MPIEPDKEDVAKYLRALAYDVQEEIISSKEYLTKLYYLMTIETMKSNLTLNIK